MHTHTKLSTVALALVVGLPSAALAQAGQTAIPGVLAAGTRVELVRDGFRALEGPVGAPDGGLLFSDVDADRAYKLAADGSVVVWREATNRANGQFLKADGGLLAAESGAHRVVAIAADRTITVLADTFAGSPLRAPNDLIADSRGGIYFTDPMPRPAPDIAPKESGRVLYRGPDGVVRLVDDEIRRPNGVSLSLDERVLYVDDTEGDSVYAFDVGVGGRVSNKRVFARLHELEQGSLGPRSRADGMAIDSDGRLYIGTSSGVQVIDSSGQHLGTIRMPAVARNVAFGGPGRHTLFVTTLTTLYRVSLLSQGPVNRSR